jgi:hypothetical protein
MKIRILSAAVVMSLLSSAALADTYQADVGVGYDRFDSSNVYSVGGSVYFAPVDDSKGPRAEAAFLNKASGISVNYSKPQDGDNAYAVSARFVMSNDYLVEARYSRQGGNAFGSGEGLNLSSLLGGKTYGIGAGLYLTDHSDLVLSYDRDTDSKSNTVGLAYHAEQPLADAASLGYEVGGSYIDSPDGKAYALDAAATYYVNPNLGLGASIAYMNGDGSITTYGVHGSYFFTPSFYVRAGYSRLSGDGAGLNLYSLRAALRF